MRKESNLVFLVWNSRFDSPTKVGRKVMTGVENLSMVCVICVYTFQNSCTLLSLIIVNGKLVDPSGSRICSPSSVFILKIVVASQKKY